MLGDFGLVDPVDGLSVCVDNADDDRVRKVGTNPGACLCRPGHHILRRNTLRQPRDVTVQAVSEIRRVCTNKIAATTDIADERELRSRRLVFSPFL